MLQLDLTQAQSSIPTPIPQEAAEKARQSLLDGSCPGSDFTGWVRLPRDYDREEFSRIQTAARRIQGDSQALVVIGIGGSYLGARAVLELLKSPNYNLLPKDTPDVYFIGNGLSGDAIAETIQLIGDKDWSINVISKSGTTLEPALAFRMFRSLLEKKYGKEGARSRIYATTDKARGCSRPRRMPRGGRALVVPDEVGGRYSGSTAVGLLPLAAAGVDIQALMDGAAAQMDECLNDPDSAAVRYARPEPPCTKRGRRSRCWHFRSHPSASSASGGGSSTPRARARTVRACSQRGWSSPPICTPSASTSRTASGTCWRRWCPSNTAAVPWWWRRTRKIWTG